jgi:hypothetical protein
MHVNGKMVPAETISGMVGVGIKENDGGVNLTMMHLISCKNFCKCHAIPIPSATIKILRSKAKKIKHNVIIKKELNQEIMTSTFKFYTIQKYTSISYMYVYVYILYATLFPHQHILCIFLVHIFIFRSSSEAIVF